jgi:hypothetical protein
MARPKKSVVEATETTESTVATEVSVEEEAPKKKSRKKSDGSTSSSKLPYVGRYHVKYWFIQPLLGSAPSDPDLYKRFIASNAPDAPTREEELLTNTVENVAAKGVNIFVRRTITGRPAVGQHTIKGFFKESMTAVRRQDNSDYEKFSAHKSKIVGNVTIKPIWINLDFPEEMIVEKTEEEFKKTGFENYQVVKFPATNGRFVRHMLKNLDRPLQADTAKGKITSIASSEIAPAGTTIEYDITFEAKDVENGVFDMLLRGADHGTGQWRGSGEYGAFVCEVRPINEDGSYGDICVASTKSVIGVTSEDKKFEDKLWEFIEETCL